VLCSGVVADLFQFEVRKVGHLIPQDDAIDEDRANGFKRLLDRAAQLAGPCRTKSLCAASARQLYEVRLGNSMPSRYAGSPLASASRGMSPNDALLYTTTLTGSLWCTAVRNSLISMLNPPSPQSAMTWRERSRA